MSGDAARDWARRIGADGAGTLRERLLREPPALPLKPTRGDYDLNPDVRPPLGNALLPAAVLLPIIRHPDPSVLFTRRTEHLSRHAGQVSFPGGRAHESDRSLVETALRETAEEVGIAPAFVSIAGFLDPYETGTGFAILPVVGIVHEGFTLAPDANEVAEVFEVPLAFLLDPRNRERHSTEWEGTQREFYVFQHDGHYIWGATAAILVNFGERILSG